MVLYNAVSSGQVSWVAHGHRSRCCSLRSSVVCQSSTGRASVQGIHSHGLMMMRLEEVLTMASKCALYLRLIGAQTRLGKTDLQISTVGAGELCCRARLPDNWSRQQPVKSSIQVRWPGAILATASIRAMARYRHSSCLISIPVLCCAADMFKYVHCHSSKRMACSLTWKQTQCSPFMQHLPCGAG